MIYFQPEVKCCPNDGARLKVLKTGRRQVYSTIIGTFTAYYTEYHCPVHPELGVFKSEELQEIVASGCNFAYDVITEIGYLRYFHHYQVEEIMDISRMLLAGIHYSLGLMDAR